MKQQDEKQFDPEDPRLTAYALGELEAEERAEVEALLAGSSEAQAFVTEVRATAEELGTALSEEPALELSGEQRAAIEAACAPARPAAPRRRGWGHPLVRLAAAAVIVLTAGTFAWYQIARDRGWSPFAGDQATPFAYSIDGGGTVARRPAEHSRMTGIGYLDEAEPRALSSQEVEALRALGYGGGGPAGSPGGSQSTIHIQNRRSIRTTYSVESTISERQLLELENLGYTDEDSSTRPDTTKDTRNEAYATIVENPFRLVREEPRSTFSIDVDTASYSNVRRFLKNGQLPPPDAVRVEELINYFSYDYPQPAGQAPFSVNAETTACPWAPEHRLVQIGLQGRELDDRSRPPANLVFLIDVSGSMKSANKLELVKQGLAMLIENLDGRDSVAICVYAGSSGVVQPPTNARHKAALLESIDRLAAGGSTNGGQGIQLAYDLARQQFDSEAANRVILATDGDFNVGITNRKKLIELIEQEARSGVFLTVMGFGMGNLKDATLEQLADKGNGHYAYIDGLDEARKVMVEEMVATLVTIAKDVKIQIEFNPLQVGAWRLIGYENRILAHRDFDDDKKDAGEIGAGHTVTALYEVVPLAALGASGLVEELRYQEPADEPETLQPTHRAESGELLFARLRYKQPDGDTSSLIEAPLYDSHNNWWEASDDLQHAAAVAAFGLKLRGSRYAGELSWKELQRIAHEGRGEDYDGRRAEFIELVKRARNLSQE